MADKDEHHSATLNQKEWDEALRRFYDDQEQLRREQAPKAETVGHRQVRDMYERQIPALPPEVQARWDAWFDSRCKSMIVSEWNEWGHTVVVEMLLKLCGEIGGATGKAERKLCDQLRKEFADEISKLKKDFAAKILKVSKATGARSGNVIDLPNPIVRKQ